MKFYLIISAIGIFFTVLGAWSSLIDNDPFWFLMNESLLCIVVLFTIYNIMKDKVLKND